MKFVKFGAFMAGACAVFSASAETFQVSTVEELKEAAASVAAKDVILIAERDEPYVLDAPLNIACAIEIRGVKADWTTPADREKVILDGDGKCRVISASAVITLQSLTIAHGYVEGSKDSGAGVYSTTSLTASNCVFFACTNAAFSGGAVATQNGLSSGTFRQCLFKDNFATGHGGVFYKHGQGSTTYTVRDCQFVGNASAASGGVWYGENGDFFGSVYDSTFEGNSAGVSGGVFWGDVYVVSNCTFTGNAAVSEAGVHYVNGNSHRAGHVFYDCRFVGNHANTYGALLTAGARNSTYKTRGTQLVRCTFDGNWADFRGAGAIGGLFVSIDDCTFVNNSATNRDMRYISSQNSPSGGAMSGSVGRMRNCVFSNNVARCYGGAWGSALVETNEYYDFVCEVKGTKFYANRVEGNARFYYNTTGGYRNWGAGGSAIHFSGSGIKFDTCEFVGNLCTNSYYALPIDADHPSEYGAKSAATVYGGAVYSGHMSSATTLWGTEFTNCVFRANLVSSPLGGSCYGAAFTGMFAGSGRKMVDCVFDSNTNLSAAAGTVTLDIPDKCPALTNATHRFIGCLFTNNYDAVAALQHCWGYADLLRCKFIGNACTGARLCTNIGLSSTASKEWKPCSYAHGEATVRDCEFRGNTRQKGCAGLIVSQHLTPITTEHDPELAIRNCLFADNAAQGSSANGGALSLPALAYGTIENCTFADNSAATSGGAVYVDGNTFEKAFTNCLFCGNSAPAGKGPDVQDTTGGATFDHSIFTADAKFADAAHGDYSLTKHSPARNAGTNLTWMAGVLDLSGQRKRVRINEEIVDVGCYEFRPIPGLLLFVW